MSILIKGMEMPTNCAECPVNMNICKRGYKYLLEHPELYDKRADDCPIVPVPAHGRLIDADRVSLEGGPYEYDEWCKWALDQYQDAPTIIPAEEGE